MKPYLELAIGFARTGVTGYGGGPSTIPLIEFEAVKKYKWMSEEEFGEILALANTMPGPIATKMAAYIGFKVKGGLGATVAILTHILPSIIAMLGLLGVLYSFRQSPIVSGMVQGVTPVIGFMLAEMAYRFFQKGSKGLGMAKTLLLAAISLIFVQIMEWHPGILIAAVLISAFYIAHRKEKTEKSVKEEFIPVREKSS
ncbi:chromate transporter [Bacillus sp. ISL-47]|uniref:chromate transporter n=1 Tax=Bacillus sp. ISL-47 TaxID=2819130 RepID=UPI001BE6BC92|nr:chromate transporter [Bacillus sp. ISL-47]MBT2690364.1 chromate transporter [Bacillus sp. ISL-47]MBT2709186.1 chromate transporter [Pseudomonas sp. ISL-84]